MSTWLLRGYSLTQGCLRYMTALKVKMYSDFLRPLRQINFFIYPDIGHFLKSWVRNFREWLYIKISESGFFWKNICLSVTFFWTHTSSASLPVHRHLPFSIGHCGRPMRTGPPLTTGTAHSAECPMRGALD